MTKMKSSSTASSPPTTTSASASGMNPSNTKLVPVVALIAFAILSPLALRATLRDIQVTLVTHVYIDDGIYHTRGTVESTYNDIDLNQEYGGKRTYQRTPVRAIQKTKKPFLRMSSKPKEKPAVADKVTKEFVQQLVVAQKKHKQADGNKKPTKAERTTTKPNNNNDHNISYSLMPPIQDRDEVLRQLYESTTPWSNVTTAGFGQNRMYSGYRNQIMAFTAFVMRCKLDGVDQILLDTFPHKDVFGTNQLIPHEMLFDVQHWNSYYPALPRIVRCDPNVLPDYDCDNRGWKDLNGTNPTRPLKMGKQHHFFGAYMRFSMGKGVLMEAAETDRLILKGALKLQSNLRNIADRALMDPTTHQTVPYLTLHARVEPDMVAHDMPQCRNQKITNLTHIFHYLEQEFPKPHFQRIFMPINRDVLEEGAAASAQPKDKDSVEYQNWKIAVENLQALNHARHVGLYNGKVKVVEFGAAGIANTPFYGKFKVTIGAVLNFYLTEHSQIFVGTEISSWSSDIMRTRFYKGELQNYKYLPDGLHRWTIQNMTNPPGFAC